MGTRVMGRIGPRIAAATSGLAAMLAAGSAWAQETAGEATEAAAEAAAEAAEAAAPAVSVPVDELWVIVAAALVFFMQAGFLGVEVGAVRRKNATITAFKNMGDWMVISVVFLIAGFGLMFGTSSGGWFGTSFFLGEGIAGPDAIEGVSPLGWTFVVFQLAFAGTSATIVSGAMAERTGFKAYLAFTIVMGILIYPVYGHWVWGNLYIADNAAFLADMGYVDFAGSSVVHMVGGFAAMAGIMIVGPRLGRYTSDGKLTQLESNSRVWSILGVLILWFGWWGFNGGSELAVDGAVGLIIFNTNLAASVGGISGFVHSAVMQQRRDIEEKTLNGVLGGLVAITACCHVVDPMGAIAVGAIAGVVQNYAYDLIVHKLKLDDVVSAVPVHGFCGIVGIMSVALFATEDALTGWDKSRAEMIGIQATGAAVAVVWAFVTAYITFTGVKSLLGIRVDPMREIRGLTLSAEAASEHHGGSTDAGDEDEELDLYDEEDELIEEARKKWGDDRFDQF